MPDSAAVTARTDIGMQFPQHGRERHMLGLGDVPARVVTQVFDLETLLDTAPLGMLDSGAARPNVLITCLPDELLVIQSRLERVAVQPVHTCVVGVSLEWPSLTSGTMIVRDLAELTMPQQIALYDWLTERAGQVQVLGLTTAALAPLVERGLFLQALYSRLNLLQATSAGRLGRARA